MRYKGWMASKLSCFLIHPAWVATDKIKKKVCFVYRFAYCGGACKSFMLDENPWKDIFSASPVTHSNPSLFFSKISGIFTARCSLMCCFCISLARNHLSVKQCDQCVFSVNEVFCCFLSAPSVSVCCCCWFLLGKTSQASVFRAGNHKAFINRLYTRLSHCCWVASIIVRTKCDRLLRVFVKNTVKEKCNYLPFLL